MPEGTALLKHDFVLVTEEESKDLREKSSRAALKKLGFGENREDRGWIAGAGGGLMLRVGDAFVDHDKCINVKYRSAYKGLSIYREQESPCILQGKESSRKLHKFSMFFVFSRLFSSGRLSWLGLLNSNQ